MLIAALLELKSRLHAAARGRGAAETSSPARRPTSCSRGCSRPSATALPPSTSRDRLADEHGQRFRSAPLPQFLRRADLSESEAVYDPAQLGAAIGGMLRMPPPLSLGHLTIPRVTVAERLRHLRGLLRRGIAPSTRRSPAPTA